mmetsp:Transcript_19552/g.41179  ORF Transcript_19552/g.41179 Transcript_19552/m.41179 type:complete len:287 (-) Transcript_19552:55-915(-)
MESRNECVLLVGLSGPAVALGEGPVPVHVRDEAVLEPVGRHHAVVGVVPGQAGAPLALVAVDHEGGAEVLGHVRGHGEEGRDGAHLLRDLLLVRRDAAGLALGALLLDLLALLDRVHVASAEVLSETTEGDALERVPGGGGGGGGGRRQGLRALHVARDPRAEVEDNLLPPRGRGVGVLSEGARGSDGSGGEGRLSPRRREGGGGGGGGGVPSLPHHHRGRFSFFIQVDLQAEVALEGQAARLLLHRGRREGAQRPEPPEHRGSRALLQHARRQHPLSLSLSRLLS